MRVPTAAATLVRTSLLAVAFVATVAAQPVQPTAPESTAKPPEPAPPAPAAQITLEQAVRMALENNLTLFAERYSRDTAREAVVVANSAYDPVFALTARDRYDVQPRPSTTVDSNQSDTRTANASVSQRIDTGATVTVTTNLSRSGFVGGAATDNLQYGSDVSLRVAQPLLSGGGLATNRATRQRTLIGVDRSDIAFKGIALDVVRDTEIAFFDLASARQQLEVQVSGLASAQTFLDENEARREAGLATELDVMQARVGVANRRSSILTAEQRVRDATDRLLALLGRTDFSGPVEPSGVTFAPPEPVSVEKSYSLAVQRDTNILNARAQIKQFELDVKVASNQRLPRVDLGGTLGYSGRDTDRLFDAVGKVPDGDAYNWQVDLTVNVPWAMREGRSRLRTSKLTLEQQKARLNQLEQDLVVRVRAAVRAVQKDVQSTEITSLATELSVREYQLEKAKFDSGLSTSRLVVEAQQRQDEARVTEMQSRVQLKQDVARLRRIEGESLEIYGVDVSKK